MFGNYAAEMLKLRKRAAVWILLGAALLVSLIFGYVLPYLGYLTGEDNPQTAGTPRAEVLAGVLPEGIVPNALGGVSVFAGALALAFGALVVGGEYGWGTVKTVLTQGPGRLSVLGAQFAALASILLVWVAATFLACGLCSLGIAAAEDQPLQWPSFLDLAAGLGTGWLAMLVWCLAGALLGIAFRGVALPIGLGIVWVLGIELLLTNTVRSLLPDLEAVTDVLPGVNAGSLVYAVTAGAPDAEPPGVTDAVSSGRALVTLAAYGVAFVVGSAALLRRRDVL